MKRTVVYDNLKHVSVYVVLALVACLIARIGILYSLAIAVAAALLTFVVYDIILMNMMLPDYAKYKKGEDPSGKGERVFRKQSVGSFVINALICVVIAAVLFYYEWDKDILRSAGFGIVVALYFEYINYIRTDILEKAYCRKYIK